MRSLTPYSDFPLPPTPKMPTTPGNDRLRGPMKRISNMSQGIRSLQARVRVLRDESDRVLEESEASPESKSSLLLQYDSIGTDLRDLMQEWEQGRVALHAALSRHSHSRSASTNRLSTPLSPAISLSGSTAVDGSPQDALQALNGPRRSLSRSSTVSSNSEEHIFEAIAAPRHRSALSREERLAKMKSDRARQATARESVQANTHMLKELETVIKLRPRGRTTGRLTSI